MRASRTDPQRPTRQLLEQLPRLQFSDSGCIDVSQSSPALLRSNAEDAETTLSTIHQGLGAIGHLLAHSADPIEDGTIGADSLESLGFLMAEGRPRRCLHDLRRQLPPRRGR